MNRILIAALAAGLAACSGGEDLEWLAVAGETGDVAVAMEPDAWEPESSEPGAPGPEAQEENGNGPAADQEAQQERRVIFVDVRRADELAAGYVRGAIHIPHGEIAARWQELEEYRDDHIVLYCRTGRRSGIAEQILRQAGFQNLYNGGGLRDLERQGVPTVR